MLTTTTQASGFTLHIFIFFAVHFFMIFLKPIQGC